MSGEFQEHHFADFTRENYRRLLRMTRETWVFRGYTELDREERFVLWRHDVDFSVHAARALARIEAEEGVRATYFVHLHNEFYNLLERGVSDCLREILALGHRLGLHFDTHYYGARSEEEVDRLVQREAGLLTDLFGAPVDAFSFHNTDPFTLSCRRWTYGGLVNTYAQYFQAEVGYCSDSNGIWRFRRLEDVLREGRDPRLQVLTHPAWWQERPMAPRERIQRCIDGRARRTAEWYDGFLDTAGRPNVGAGSEPA